MEAHVSTQTPPAVERLVCQLRHDCGSSAKIEVTPQGSSHGGTTRHFEIGLVAKKQRLSSLCRLDYLDIIQVLSKRSGAFVRTTIEVRVSASITTNGAAQ